jgi:surfeit locus 1 family protein
MTSNRISSPGFLMALAAVIVLGGFFAWLGRWQLERAEVNRLHEARFGDAADLPVLHEPVGDAELDQMRFRRMRLSGRFESERQILLDNMTRNGAAGFEVLTPFAVAGDERIILVNRGWVGAAADRSELPEVAIASGPASVSGVIDRFPQAAIPLGQTPSDQAVAVLSYPDIDELESALGREIHRYQLKLDASQANGFDRGWPMQQGRADRNIAYAVQWFGLSGLALIIAIGMVWRRAAMRSENAN